MSAPTARAGLRRSVGLLMLAACGVYASIPWGGLLAGWVRAEGMAGAVYIAALFLIAAAVTWHGRRARWGRVEAGIALGAIGLLCLVGMRITLLEERTHLIEYAVIGLLAYEVMSRWRPASGLLPWGARALACGLGVIAELLQGLHPERVFDLRDILFNTIASAAAVGGSTAIQAVRNRRHGSAAPSGPSP